MSEIIVVKHKAQVGVSVSADHLHVVIDSADTAYEYEYPDRYPESYSSVSIEIEEIPNLIDALTQIYSVVKDYPKRIRAGETIDQLD